MKKTIIFTFVLSLVTFCQLKSQNTYDTYNTYCGEYPAVDPDDPSTLFYSSPTAGYLGEYQIFLNNHPWTTSPALNANAISYKIEAVSSNEVELNGKSIPVGRSYQESMKGEINGFL